MRTRMRMCILSLLRWSGFMWAWRFLHRYDVNIIMVHGLMNSDNNASWVPLRPQLHRRRFESFIRYLSKYYHFVSLQDALEMLAGQKPPQPYSLVLTFDDGYRNNITHALPILRRYGAPATIFLVTGHIEDRKPFWFDRLDYVLQHVPVDGREVRIGPTTVRLRSGDRAALRSSYKRLRDAAKAVQRHDIEMVQEMEGIAAMLEAESGRKLADIFEDDDWSAVLTWEDIRRASAQGVSFGSHTVDHIRLGLVDDEMIRDQLTRSKEMIEAQTGQPCRHLCYPSGSFNRRAVEIARACGYASALTSAEGTNRVGDNPMTLRRIGLPDTDCLTETLAQVSGLSNSISRFVGRLEAVLPKRMQADHHKKRVCIPAPSEHGD